MKQTPSNKQASRIKFVPRTVAAALILMLCMSCGFQIGPAYPEKDGSAFLAKKGYPAATVDAVVTGGMLAATQVVDLAASKSIDVRFLVARNSHLTTAQIDVFIKDKNDFVRSGAACNPNLTSNQVDLLMGDASHTVRMQLAGNPSLTEEELLRMHTNKKADLLSFSFNPNCPDVIRAEILASKDTLAQHWLNTIEGWKKDGHFVHGPDGRWRKP